jgi:hypothetical protein
MIYKIKQMKLAQLILAFLFITSIFSCKKEGPPGKDGKDGNANVQSSTITFSSWNWDSGNNYEYSDFTWSAITSSIASNGAVLVYLSTPAGWAPLPRTVYPTTGYSQSQRFVYNTGTLRIIVQDSDLTQPAPLGTWTIKVLAIESNIRKANPDLDWSNYNEVKGRFHLED